LQQWDQVFAEKQREYHVANSGTSGTQQQIIDIKRLPSEPIEGRKRLATGTAFGARRPWNRQDDRFYLAGLKNRSFAPRRRRRPTWTTEQLMALRELRRCYPR
jgi:hypothetical protein